MRCYICDGREKTSLVKGKFICRQCRIASGEIPKAHYYHVEALVAELEERIPQLFEEGHPVCPGNGYSCCCSYKDGCSLLKSTRQKKDPELKIVDRRTGDKGNSEKGSSEQGIG